MLSSVMWIFLFFLLVTGILLNIRKSNFDSVFVSLSFFYVFVFFVYPLYFLGGNENVSYLGNSVVQTRTAFIHSAIGVLIFLSGFMVLSWILHFFEKRVRGPGIERSFAGEAQQLVVNRWFWFFFFVVFLNFVFNLLDGSRAEEGYLIRQGVQKGSWFGFLFDILVNALAMSVLLLAMSIKRSFVVFVLGFLFVLSLLTGATSRATILVFIAVLAIYYIKVRVNLVVVFFLLVFPLAVPFLINMKYVISSVALGNGLPDIFLFYESSASAEAILGNFGHPLFSFVFVDELIDLVGYRYFYDYLQGFLFYFKAIGLDFGESLTYYNTEVLLGRRESIVPTGYLAFGYVQLSYLGVFLSGVFYRLVGCFAKYAYRSFDRSSESVKFYFANLAAYTFYVGEIRTMVITFLVPVLVVIFSSRLMVDGRRSVYL